MKYSDPALERICKSGGWFTISNILTYIRILLTPVIVAGIFYKHWYLVFYIFIAASLTDLLDGYLARLFNQQTTLGACLDPIADKIFLISIFSSLAFLDSPFFHIPVWFVIFILCRESVILLGTYVMMRAEIDVKIDPSIWGKLTTFFQILFIAWIFICYFMHWMPSKTYYTLLSFITFFSVFSLIQYISLGIRYLRNR
ncbi:MAG: CDP-alcohol phosphatidyltransferase family protein [bacterium]